VEAEEGSGSLLHDFPDLRLRQPQCWFEWEQMSTQWLPQTISIATFTVGCFPKPPFTVATCDRDLFGHASNHQTASDVLHGHGGMFIQ